MKQRFFAILLMALVGLLFSGPAARANQDAAKDSAPQAASSASDTKAGGYVGSEACKGCHVEEYKSWENSPHWKTSLNTRDGAAHQGCEACHGPGASHIADPTDASKLFLFEKASAKDVTKQCLTCHAGGKEHMNALNSVHTENGVSCTSCHSPHHATTKEFLLLKSQPELCYTCHLAKKAEFAMPFHHRVNEGLIQCSDCHNVHGTVGPKQVRTASTQDATCFKCHIDKQGPFVYEHAPIKTDGCQSCHLVHGGPNAHMLKVSNVNLLCLQCHTTSSFSSAPGAPSFHNQASFFQSCVLCHSSIHGSNFNSFFFK
ncbi:MAG TPA: DmsE family decaheme c-type cytochrome [Candidatus Acidoferrum sp.]|nr:DmsE family decaheme c-type cytochrome [Candidatus Acidoferrum sp.]